MFQSTLPHSERHDPDEAKSNANSCFNTRSRTGSDRASHSRRVQEIEFQSTPPHGERHFPSGLRRPQKTCFNPRPRTGSDCLLKSSLSSQSRFNPRPRTGSDSCNIFMAGLRYRFKPRPRTGSDFGLFRIFDKDGVSIHAPARGATPLRPRTRIREWFQSTPPHGERRG